MKSVLDDSVYWFLELGAQRPNSATCHVRIQSFHANTPESDNMLG